MLHAIALKPKSLLAWVEIGGSSADTARRRGISPWWGILEQGYQWFYQNRVQPVMDWGADGTYLHNPFGTDGARYMQFDQFSEHRRAGLIESADDFRQATRDFRAANPGKFLGAYLGDVRTLLTHEPDPWARLRRVIDSLSPFADVVDEICIDGAAAHGPETDDASFYVTGLLRALGIPVRIECQPGKDHPFMARFPSLAEEQVWQDGFARGWAMPRAAINPSIIRVSKPFAPGQTWENRAKWIPAQVRRILADNCSAAVDAPTLVALGKRRDVLGAG